MRVCIDIQSTLAHRTGVGRYTKSLVDHLAPLAGGDELSLFHFDFRRRGLPFDVPGARRRAVAWMPGRLAQQAWKRLGFPPFDWFAGPADVYHFPNFILPPLTRGRSVVTIHDVSFLRFPETLEAKNLRYLKARIGATVARADRIITVCEFTGREVVEALRVPAAKVVAIPSGLPDGFTRPPAGRIQDVRARHRLDRPYLLFVGTIEPRKNLPFLVEVFERLRGFDGDLVIAGMKGWKVEPILDRIRGSPLAARIRLLDYVADEDLPGLYAGAEVFVLPSLYEGFGFPPLEAMACRTPVVASEGGSLPEVLGDGALIVRGFDAEHWAAEVESVVTDPSRRADLLERGAARARAFAWSRTAQQTWDLYRSLAS